jgi:predicted peptidase
MKKLLMFLFCFLGIATFSFGQNEYEKKTFVSTSGDSLNYRLLRPELEQEGKKYPLVLFLHGAGERGSDNEKQLFHGSQMWLNPVNRENYPAFVLFPQCPESGYWAYVNRPSSFETDKMPIEPPISPIFVALKELLDSYLTMPQVDKRRIYVIGLSMGAMGTYDLTIRYPELFAAAIPICGTVNADRLKAAKKVKFRIFHGDADNVVPVSGSRQAYKALKSAGADVEYFEFPGVGHVSWNEAFNRTDFMSWLFRQKKK